MPRQQKQWQHPANTVIVPTSCIIFRLEIAEQSEVPGLEEWGPVIEGPSSRPMASPSLKIRSLFVLAQSRGRHFELSSYTQHFLPSSLHSADSRQIVVSPDDSCLSLVVNGSPTETNSRCEIDRQTSFPLTSAWALEIGNYALIRT